MKLALSIKLTSSTVASYRCPVIDTEDNQSQHPSKGLNSLCPTGYLIDMALTILSVPILSYE